jgi:colicin import membrane protein
LISFSSRAFESVEVEAIPVEFVTDDQLSRATAGSKSGKKENPKPLVEKVAEAKPVDDAVGKISEKQPIVTDAAPDPTPPLDKPVEKKPDPPKPVAESKPKVEPKPIEKKPDPPKVDPIAEAMKKEEAKKPKQVATPQAKAAPPPPVKKHEYKFSAETIAAQLDKRDPTRQAYAGETQNSNPALGTATGTASSLSANYNNALILALQKCWSNNDPEDIRIPVTLKFKIDGTLASDPYFEIQPRDSRERAIFEQANRAIIGCQPFTMLPPAQYNEWKTKRLMLQNKEEY